MVKSENKVNKKVIVYSILALICLASMFILHDWIFIAPAVYLVWLNQKELSK